MRIDKPDKNEKDCTKVVKIISLLDSVGKGGMVSVLPIAIKRVWPPYLSVSVDKEWP